MDTILDALERADRATRTKYWGKYRAFVADNTDPERLGRCRLIIPSVLGEIHSEWALPCSPYGGGADFGFLAIPPQGAQVIAEFLEGDVSSPLWSGAFWRQASELPAESAGAPAVKILKSESGHVLSFDDSAEGETILCRSAAHASVLMDPDGSLVLTDRNGATVRLDVPAGEIAIDDANGNTLVMKSTGVTCSDANGNTIVTHGSGVEVKSSASINIQGSLVTIGGGGGEPLVKGTSFLAMFNTHVHNTTSISAPTSPPLTPLTSAILTTKSTAK